MKKYVVKATSPDGSVSWLSAAPLGAARACDSLAKAEIFRTRVEASQAVMAMPPALSERGVTFSIEAAADSPANP